MEVSWVWKTSQRGVTRGRPGWPPAPWTTATARTPAVAAATTMLVSVTERQNRDRAELLTSLPQVWPPSPSRTRARPPCRARQTSRGPTPAQPSWPRRRRGRGAPGWGGVTTRDTTASGTTAPSMAQPPWAGAPLLTSKEHLRWGTGNYICL